MWFWLNSSQELVYESLRWEHMKNMHVLSELLGELLMHVGCDLPVGRAVYRVLDLILQHTQPPFFPTNYHSEHSSQLLAQQHSE